MGSHVDTLVFLQCTAQGSGIYVYVGVCWCMCWGLYVYIWGIKKLCVYDCVYIWMYICICGCGFIAIRIPPYLYNSITLYTSIIAYIYIYIYRRYMVTWYWCCVGCSIYTMPPTPLPPILLILLIPIHLLHTIHTIYPYHPPCHLYFYRYSRD